MALVLPDDDGRERLAGLGVPREHRLALVVEPAAGDLAGRVGEQLGDRVDDRVEDLVAVLLDPAGMRVARLLAPAGLAERAQLVVVEDGLDARSCLRRRRSGSCATTAPASARRASGRQRRLLTPARRASRPRARRCPSDARQAGRADRRDVDELRAGARAPDHVVDARARRGAGRRRRATGSPEARAASRRLGAHLGERLRAHRPVALVGLVDRRRAGDDVAVDGREHQHSLRALVGNRQQDAVERVRRTRRTRPCADRSRSSRRRPGGRPRRRTGRRS